MHYNLFGGLQRKRGRALPLLGIEHHPVNVAPLRGMHARVVLKPTSPELPCG